MSQSVNKAILIGNCTRDPEIRYSQSGAPIANLSIATSASWKDKNGQKQEKTEFHRVTVFSKLAEVVRDYVKKGQLLYVEGAIKYSDYINKEGNKVYTTTIELSGFDSKLVMLGGKPGNKPEANAAPTEAPGDFQASDEDIPF